MRLADLGSVMALVGKLSKVLSFEAIDIAKVPRIPLAIFGVRFAAGWDVVI